MATSALDHPSIPAGHDPEDSIGPRHPPRHRLHRAGLLRDLQRPGDLVAHLGPNWYASIMGTGIVANAAVTLPRQVPGLHSAALIVWGGASVMLVALTAASAVHWARHRTTARRHAANPVMAQFYGAPPMALLTVGAGTLLLGKDVLGEPLALHIDIVLWAVGTVAGLAAAVAIPYLMFTRHELAPDSTFGGWLMPVVPPMVSAATGALLVPYAPAGQFRLTLLLGCYAMFGLSLIASLIVTTLIWYRLTMHKLGPAATVPTLWIVLGWLGQSITAVNLLGNQGTPRARPALLHSLRGPRARLRSAGIRVRAPVDRAGCSDDDPHRAATPAFHTDLVVVHLPRGNGGHRHQRTGCTHWVRRAGLDGRRVLRRTGRCLGGRGSSHHQRKRQGPPLPSRHTAASAPDIPPSCIV